MADDATDDPVSALAASVFTRILGGYEALSMYLGDRLGMYTALGSEPATADQLAARVSVHPRYAREWLEQQAVAGLVTVRDDDGERLFSLSAPQRAVLADPSSLAFSTPFARMLEGAAARMPELLAAYRDGTGVSWDRFGPDARDAQGDANRPWFEERLAPALSGVPRLDGILARPDARVLDVGCGHGWSSIALARAYPRALVEGIDVDAPSIEAAQRHAAGMPAVTFTLLRGESLSAGRESTADIAFIFEALHDMPDPVGVLRSIRTALRPGGVLVVMDEAVADAFAPDGDEVERIMYGYSLLICLPDSMSTPGSIGTGTVMRRSTLEGYAREAGYAAVSVLPIEDFAAFRFYLLEP